MLHHNELITIEEDTILGSRSMLRRFTLQNRANKLALGVLSSGGSVCTCRLENGKHEIVLPAIGKKDLESYPSSSEWQPHVLGLDSLLLTTASQSLSYQLTTNNELHVTGKLRQFNALAPFYVNLNSTQSLIDGHLLHVRSATDDPLLATGDVKFDPRHSISLAAPAADAEQTVALIQDTIYSPDPAAHPPRTNDSIIAVLSYENRSLEVLIQSNASSIPKLRLRIRRDGVSLMPSQMTDFKCIYKMRW